MVNKEHKKCQLYLYKGSLFYCFFNTFIPQEKSKNQHNQLLKHHWLASKSTVGLLGKKLPNLKPGGGVFWFFRSITLIVSLYITSLQEYTMSNGKCSMALSSQDNVPSETEHLQSFPIIETSNFS